MRTKLTTLLAIVLCGYSSLFAQTAKPGGSSKSVINSANTVTNVITAATTGTSSDGRIVVQFTLPGSSVTISGNGITPVNNDTALALKTGTYNIAVVSPTGCRTYNTTATVGINGIPTPTFIVNNATICAYDTVDVTITSNQTVATGAPTMYYVYAGATVIDSSAVSNVIRIPGSKLAIGASSLTVLCKYSLGLSPSSTATSVTKNGVNTLTTLVTAATTASSTDGRIVVQFTIPSSVVVVSGNGITPITNDTASNLKSGTYTITVTSPSSCVTTTTATIGVNGIPTPSFVVNNATLCANDTVDVTITTNQTVATGAPTMRYVYAGATVIDSSATSNVIRIPAAKLATGANALTVVCKYTLGLSAASPATNVTKNAAVSVVFTDDAGATICKGVIITYGVTNNGTNAITCTIVGGSTYLSGTNTTVTITIAPGATGNYTILIPDTDPIATFVPTYIIRDNVTSCYY